MSRRTVAIGIFILVGLIAAVFLYNRFSVEEQAPSTASETPSLVRPHSPIIGPADAPVTIVEFFDPSCESCRAFYPVVKRIMAEYPDDVRLAIRYALFHKGSEEASRILEAARKQGLYVPVLEAVLAAQPQWHDDPKIQAAWEAAEAAGLDLEKARVMMNAPDVTAALNQDAVDIQALKLRGTPTFFVNQELLPRLDPQQLYEMVRSEVAKHDDNHGS
ncbi:MAG TPA: disulfide bond formation protein DsbA [Pseudomonas xinjiangensis]|uniref:Disulfide bond formation protein DsbA n=2 Tax=root TaxID=1 RepID=A0A7V1BRJ5_9GAMM|nr:disulfide bond formation protein DsbA [Halopseudomonas xinjiangensis]HEC46519.1 disulfide bond formation protein DsbA [Halopseudomonas xinjiangensis]